ncbi:hypothetical protein ADUPG1_005457, partial [Aduncisulcus paluster]
MFGTLPGERLPETDGDVLVEQLLPYGRSYISHLIEDLEEVRAIAKSQQDEFLAQEDDVREEGDGFEIG